LADKSRLSHFFKSGTLVNFSILSFTVLLFISWGPVSSETSKTALKVSPIVKKTLILRNHPLPRHSNITENLKKIGIPRKELPQITKQLKGKINFRRIKARTMFVSKSYPYPLGSLQEVMIYPNNEKKIIISLDENKKWKVVIKDRVKTIKTMSFRGKIKSSLWQSAVEVGLKPTLIEELAKIFAWQVDFNREVRPEDSWRLVVERVFTDGKASGWGKILVAEYSNKLDNYIGIRFPQEAEHAHYYDLDGKSLKNKFLKSPLNYRRISSRFKRRRFHPILKKMMRHTGVDYSARKGTPVMTVGDGVVTHVGRLGGAGNTVKIRHNSIYKTSYKHLSKFSKKLRKGSRVKQGQVIGYVGSTGLATGPHLHFEFYEKSRFVDPLGRKFPRGKPVPKSLLGEYLAMVKVVIPLLPDRIDQRVVMRNDEKNTK
jgi:murein DD-endopeptidase MepM/ murein hydrolase activator NlpD